VEGQGEESRVLYDKIWCNIDEGRRDIGMERKRYANKE
jgi:hypothetical protein